MVAIVKKGIKLYKNKNKLIYDNLPIFPVLKAGEMEIFISEAENTTLETVEIFRPESEEESTGK